MNKNSNVWNIYENCSEEYVTLEFEKEKGK